MGVFFLITDIRNNNGVERPEPAVDHSQDARVIVYDVMKREKQTTVTRQEEFPMSELRTVTEPNRVALDALDLVDQWLC